jgi:hypothetical protein
MPSSKGHGETAQNTMDRNKSNASVVNQIKPRDSLETLAVIEKLKYFGHIKRTSDSLEKDLMLGSTDGSRRRGKQWTKWTDKI